MRNTAQWQPAGWKIQASGKTADCQQTGATVRTLSQGEQPSGKRTPPSPQTETRKRSLAPCEDTRSSDCLLNKKAANNAVAELLAQADSRLAAFDEELNAVDETKKDELELTIAREVCHAAAAELRKLLATGKFVKAQVC